MQSSISRTSDTLDNFSILLLRFHRLITILHSQKENTTYSYVHRCLFIARSTQHKNVSTPALHDTQTKCKEVKRSEKRRKRKIKSRKNQPSCPISFNYVEPR